jgi:putative chitinase
VSLKFNFTQSQLAQLLPSNLYIEQWYHALSKILPDYDIDTSLRVAAFISQCSHESAEFTVLKENLNYRAEGLMRTWPSRFPNTDMAQQYAMKPEMIANKVYSNRMGNSDEASGDGAKYIGRGLIQLTGKDNYKRFAESIRKPLEDIPEYLLTFEGAVQSACWFWQDKKLNEWADVSDVLTLTKRINGGVNGLADREKKYAYALQVLSSNDYTNQITSSTVVLRRGSRGNAVATMQLKLGLTADGDFGPATERALMEWQRSNGLVPDGVAGPATLAKLIG